MVANTPPIKCCGKLRYHFVLGYSIWRMQVPLDKQMQRHDQQKNVRERPVIKKKDSKT